MLIPKHSLLSGEPRYCSIDQEMNISPLYGLNWVDMFLTVNFRSNVLKFGLALKEFRVNIF